MNPPLRQRGRRTKHLPLPTQAAFTLLEMAVVVGIVGLMAAMVMNGGKASKPSDCYPDTKLQVGRIGESLEAYARKNDRYPTPSSRAFNTNNPEYGKEQAAGSAIDVIANGGHPVMSGAVPFQTLGLPSQFATDCWGNKFTYFVTEELTVAGGYSSGATQGRLNIETGIIGSSKPVLDNASYAVISHGEDGAGGAEQNFTGPGHKWCTTGVGYHADTENCDGYATGNVTLFDAPFNNGPDNGSTVNNAHFDDVIIYKAKDISHNCASTTETWSVGLDSCTATIAAAANLASVPANAGPDPSGSAVYKCVNGMFVKDDSAGYSCVAACGGGGGPGGGGPGGACYAACADQNLSWGTGNHCSADFNGVANGATSPMTQSTAPGGYYGAAQASCYHGALTIDASTATCN